MASTQQAGPASAGFGSSDAAVGPPQEAGMRVEALNIGDDIARVARRAIETVGPMSTILDGRRVAILKPNFVAGRPAYTGATTNLEQIGRAHV